MQHRPYCTQIELVRGCNMKCGFCANSSLPEEKKYIGIDTVLKIAEGLRPFGKRQRVLFAMRGEPTLHPELNMITSIFRELIPDIQLSLITNGIKLTAIKAKEWLHAGGNHLCIDCYGKTYSVFKERMLTGGLQTVDYEKFNIWQYSSFKDKKIILIPDLVDFHKVARNFTNQCDYIPDKAYEKYNILRPDYNNPLKKKCAFPFRELAIQFDGTIPLCCKDWKGESSFYNVNEGNLYGYWIENIRLKMFRTLLYNKNREFHPCKRCTYNGGFRLGLLPKMEILTEKRINQIKESINGKD